MLKIYGSMLCKDCVECVQALSDAKVEFEFLDFGDSLRNLKEFLKIRDTHRLFDQAKANGSIGIPTIIKEDGSITLDWDEFIS